MFLVMASDGVWDVQSNDETVQFIHDTLMSTMTTQSTHGSDSTHSSGSNAVSLLSTGKHTSAVAVDLLAQTCDKLLEKSLERGSVDNMSVILVWLNSSSGGGGTGSGSSRLDTQQEEEEVEEGEKEWISELNAAAKKLFE